MKWTFPLILVLFGFANPTAASSTQPSVDDMLLEADRVRSSDPVRFAELLADLQSGKIKKTTKQRQAINYLSAYHVGVYKDSPRVAIARAKSLYFETTDPSLKYRAGSLVANLSAIRRDFATGLRFLERSLELRDKVEDKDVRHEGLGAGAMFYNQLGQHKEGLRYADEVLRDDPSPRNRCGASYIKHEAEFELGVAVDSKAITDIDNTIAQCSSINELIFSGFSKLIQVRIYAKLGRQEDAIRAMQAAFSEIESTRYPRLIAEARSLLAELQLQEGRTSEAAALAHQVIASADDIPSSWALVSAYATLSKIAEQQQKLSDALEYYKRYAAADQVRKGDIKARELAYEIVRQETQQKNQQIQLLERQNEVLQLEQELDKQSALKSRLAMVFLMLVLAAVIYWMLQIKRHQRQLQRLAQTDMLTGVGNRHYFTLKSERALIEAAREGEQAALVMFDLDHFKAINDTYGHAAGDWVLRQVGKICRTHCRKTDFLGRIGGEEFAVMLRGVDLAEAARIAEDCRSTLAQIDTRESGYSFVVTGSFGVTSTGQSGYDLSRLMSHADQMLYRAKHEGRNRVCVYAPESPEPKPGRRSAPALTVVGR